MNKKQISCEEMDLKIMALLDNELDSEEFASVHAHIESCKRCGDEYSSQKKVKEVTADMRFKQLPEFYWDEYWTNIFNKLERGLSWIFISLGAIIILCFTGWEVVNELIADQDVNPVLKFGIFVMLIGSIVLIISILREKIMVRKVDKYRKVER
jgi:ABC-type multidrug transport system fused ATPase/permease subunit